MVRSAGLIAALAILATIFLALPIDRLSTQGRGLLVIGGLAALMSAFAAFTLRGFDKAVRFGPTAITSVGITIAFFASGPLVAPDYSAMAERDQRMAEIWYTDVVRTDNCDATASGFSTLTPSVKKTDDMCQITLDIQHNEISVIPFGPTLKGIGYKYSNDRRQITLQYPATGIVYAYLFDPRKDAKRRPEWSTWHNVAQGTASATRYLLANTD